MDQDGKESSSNSDANQSEGIFSTPELTVDTEKLAQNTNSSNANTRSRVASIFANTDAGQRSQKLDDAMGMNNVQPAQVTEDVVIDNGPRKKSKLPIIIAIIAFVAVIGGFTAWVMMRNMSANPSSAQTPKEAFDAYLNLLKSGTSDNQGTTSINSPSDDIGVVDNDQWMLFRLDNSNILNDEKTQYLNVLQQKYDIFREALAKNTDRQNYGEFSAVLEQYTPETTIMINSAYLERLDTLIANVYSSSGIEVATSYINELAPELPENIENYPLRNLSDKLREYLLNQIKLTQIYEGWGCIKNGSIDKFCEDSDNGYSVAYRQIAEKQTQNSKMIKTYFEVMSQYFIQDTNKIKELLNEEE